ncbi:alpha/beta hydrolase [Kribbella albertanoniae]|uniref:Alpha/beta hydrolase n=1 Tax=Kribbella albertanoniae TaxID=1266829 RepID=A0A4R4QAZ3_9ACTN|nr:alpha/beta hydrolase [Kribbella albertanoniae]TDC32586.1 alpha/beta hydrolase [Kribbella albertanoniae]
MEHVTSVDGTAIAYERLGSGEPVILVPGALCDRNALKPLALALAGEFDLITYDRRGRGDSGDNAPYGVEREVEDIAALLAAIGGQAAIYGHSSGAGLAAVAASSGLPFTKVVLHEPPYGPDDVDSSEDGAQVLELLREGRNQEAVEHFLLMAGMTQAEAVELAAGPGVAELAPTLAYDFAVMDYGAPGGRLPVELLAKITQPALVLAGTASPPFMIDAGYRVVKQLRAAALIELADQNHVVPPEFLAPVLRSFLQGSVSRR